MNKKSGGAEIEEGNTVRPIKTPVDSYPYNDDDDVYTLHTSGPFQVSRIEGDRLWLYGINGEYHPSDFRAI